MHAPFETILSLISPSMVATTLGYDLHPFDEVTFFYEDPFQGKVWVTREGFLIDNPQSEAKAWNIYDFMARELSVIRKQVPANPADAYLAGVRKIFSMFEDELQAFRDNWEAIAVNVASEANTRREIFQLFTIRKSREPKAEEALLLSGLQSARRALEAHNTTVSVFTGERFAVLKQLLFRLHADRQFDFPTTPRYVLPYFSDFGTLNAFELSMDLRERKGYKRVDINPDLVSYNGLLSWRPGHKVFLTSDPFHGLAVNGQFTDNHLKGVCLTPTATRMISDFAWRPAAATFINRDVGYTALQAPALLSKGGTEISVLELGEPISLFVEKPIPWLSFIVNKIIRQVQEDGDQLTPLTKLFITSCPAHPEVKQRIYNALRDSRQHRALVQLESVLHDGLFEETPLAFFYRTARGYQIEDKKMRGLLRPLTNFILEFRSRVIFPETSQNFYQVDVIVKGQRTLRLLAEDALSDMAALDKSLRGFAEEGGLTLDVESTPGVIDRTAARPLIRGWKLAMIELPVLTGISFLGWNTDRTAFYGPSFTVSASKFETEPKVLRKSIIALQAYDNTAWDIGTLSDRLPETISNIISQACAMLARTMMGFPVQPVKIRNSPTAYKLLEHLFAGIGQTRPFFFDANKRTGSELPGNQGFPGWSLGYTQGMAMSSRLPFFMLLDVGQRVTETYSDEVMAEATATFRTVFINVVRKLLQTRGAIFERSNSILYDNSLVREGQHLIQEATGLQSWPAMPAPYETVEKLLRSIPLNETAKYFTQSLRQQLIWLNLEHLPEKVNKSDLFIELTPLVQHLRDLGNAIEIDALSGMQMLNAFYNERVMTTPVDVDELIAQIPGNTANQLSR